MNKLFGKSRASKKGVQLSDLKNILVLIGFIALVGAAVGIALDEFQDETTTDSIAYNITNNGLTGVDNSTQFLDTTGTIAGVAVLIGLVVAAFAFGNR